MALADRVTVLRDGRLMATLPIGEVTRDGMVRLMVGRDVDSGSVFPKPAARRQRRRDVLELHDVGCAASACRRRQPRASAPARSSASPAWSAPAAPSWRACCSA